MEGKVCKNCGKVLAEKDAYCPDCGTKVEVAETVVDPNDNAEKELIITEGESPMTPEPQGEKEDDKTIGDWWGSKSNGARIGIIIAALVFLAFLVNQPGLTFAVVIAAALIYAIVKGTDSVRKEAVKTVGYIAAIGVGALIFAVVIVCGGDVITDTFQPGAAVRNGYFQYNETLTVEDIFDRVCSDGEWSSYKSNGTQYVRFTGSYYNIYDSLVYLDITFKIVGDSFMVDTMEVNGIEQDNLAVMMIIENICDYAVSEG